MQKIRKGEYETQTDFHALDDDSLSVGHQLSSLRTLTPPENEQSGAEPTHKFG
jgi:hypothetical protein